MPSRQTGAIVRMSQAFIPTLRAAPADASSVSHQLLLRAGFIRSLGAGIYSYLPLAQRTLQRIQTIIRAELDAIGGQEVLLPALHPAELWRQSGRWDSVDQTMFRLQDRRGGDYCLGMTHEEAMAALARDELRSYRELPQLWYQVQTKFRDEPRPRAGLLRTREFLMQDAYSFDIDEDGLRRSFERVATAYERIFARCGLEVIGVQAFSGTMGGGQSREYVLPTASGEDTVVRCPNCGYAANLEVATARVQPVVDEPGDGQLEAFATPGVVTIEALAGPPYDVLPERQLKTLVYVADEQPVVAVLRGDHQLNEAKLQLATGAAATRPASEDEVVRLMGARPGSLGAVAFQGAPVLVDQALAGRSNMVTGANRDGYHVRGVDVQRHLLEASHGQLADVRSVAVGDLCTRCGGRLETFTALEVGHIFQLGLRYSEPMGVRVLNADGQTVPVQMGSYGIGVSRLLAAAVEAEHGHDADGIIWPVSISPQDVAVLVLGAEPELASLAESISQQLAGAGASVLLDDRDERPGVKLKDADLIGLPVRIGVGKRGLAQGNRVEWKRRAAPDVELVEPADAVRRLFV